MSILAVVTTLLYWFWIKDCWWQLGLSVVNTIFLAGLGIGKKEIRKDKYLVGLWLMSLVIGWFQAWRNMAEIKFVSIVTLMAVNGYLAALGNQPKAIVDLSRIWRSGWKTIPDFFKEMIKVFGILGKIKIFSKIAGKPWDKLLTGIILAIPMLLVFGVLFYSADPIFAGLVDKIRLPEIRISGKLIYDLVTTVMVLGISLTLANFRLAKKSGKGIKIKAIDELNIASGAVAGLFLVFCLVQIRYFGVTGDGLKAMGIVYSDYTRKGYAEMLLASGLAIGIVYWLDRIKGSKTAKKIGLVLITESLIIVAAAANRNYIYQAVHGFTRIRLMGFLVSGELAAALGLAAWKVIKKSRIINFSEV